MKIKKEHQIFITSNMDQQYLPNETDDDSFIIVDGATFDESGSFIPLDLSDKKIVRGELILKTTEDLAAESQAKLDELNAQYEAQRQTALMSFELTIFSDTTLNDDQKNDIKRVRQEWRDMTEQSGYPFDFVEPKLNADLWS